MRDIKVLLVLIGLATMLLTGSPAPAQDYILGEGDLLKITVYENEDLTTNTRVSGDGMISVPLVGKMKVGGMTPGEAEQKIVQMLSQGYIIDPHVTVFVEEYKSKRVTILGEVTKPGMYELTSNESILEMISKAGGLTDKAGNSVIIKRKKTCAGASVSQAGKAIPASNDAIAALPSQLKDTDDTYITVNLKELMEKGNLAQNPDVQDGDNIFVTKSGFIYVTGEVKKPGAYKYDEGTTVMKAIALAEGLSDKAAPGRTVVIRKMQGEEKVMKVEMDFPVRADDLISVPESFF